MQLMPETARQYGVRNVFDPEDNIRGGIHNLADLLAPEASAQSGNAMIMPLIIRNDTNEAKAIKLSALLPGGWTERARFNLFTIPAHESYPLQVAVVPSGQAKQWQEVSWKVEAKDTAPATLKLRPDWREKR